MNPKSLYVGIPYPTVVGGVNILISKIDLNIFSEGYEVNMVFYTIQNPWHQPEPTVCVPTILKVIFDDQFNLRFSIRQWKNKTNWTIMGVSPYGSIRGLERHLSQHKIKVFEKIELKENQISELLKKGVIPLVYFRMNYLNEENLEPFVDEEGTKYFHPIIPVGIEDERVYIYDTLQTGLKKPLTKDNIKTIMTIPRFLQEWEHSQSRAFWFDKIKKPEKELTEFIV